LGGVILNAISNPAMELVRPVADQAPVTPPAPCFETFYDGVDDYFISSSVGLQVGGAVTFATVVKFTSLTNFDSSWNSRSGTGGLNLYVNADGSLHGLASNNLVNSIGDSSGGVVTTGVWYEIIVIVTLLRFEIYVNGILVANGASTFTTGMGAIDLDVWFCSVNGASSRVLHGYLKNTTFRLGATSAPGSWTPTDPTSLAGTTSTVMYSAKGNDENGESIVWTKFGDPVTTECA